MIPASILIPTPILILFGMSLLLMAAVIGLMRRSLFRGPSTPSAGSEGNRCGHCGYSVRGATSLHCSECGSDLREVGIRTMRRWPWLEILRRLALCLLIGGVITACLLIPLIWIRAKQLQQVQQQTIQAQQQTMTQSATSGVPAAAQPSPVQPVPPAGPDDPSAPAEPAPATP